MEEERNNFCPEESVELAERVAAIRALKQQGKAAEAMELARDMADFPTQSLQQALELSKHLKGMGLSGVGEIVLLRYRDTHPDDRQAQLAYLLSRPLQDPDIRRPRKLAVILAGFVPASLEEYTTLAQFLTRGWKTGPALELCHQALEKFPDDRNLIACLVENFNHQKDTRSALREIAKLLKVQPSDAGCDFWSFVAEQSAQAGDARIFAMAASKAEALLDDADLHSRVALLKAYHHYGDKANVERLLEGVRPRQINGVGVLAKMFDWAERYWLTGLQLGFARRLLELPIADAAARERYKNFVKKYGKSDETALNKKSLFP